MAEATLKKAAPSMIEIEGWDGEKVLEGSKEHQALLQTFDPDKRYMFELAERNPALEMPVWDMRTNRPVPNKPFMPYRGLVFTSQIVWNGQRRMIRYYDGCTTIFVDKQPQDKDLLTSLINQSKKRPFVDGKVGAYGDERMFLLYMNICSWNGNSPFKTKTSSTVFIPVNADAQADATASRIDKIEEALKLAREAKKTKMLIHASYLGIPSIDYDSGNELTEKEIRALYRNEAAQNPENFIETYGNKSIEVKYYIDKALEKGTISNRFNPNKATWGSNNTVICDISGLKSNEAIAQKLFEFSQTEEGEEFLVQLKAISE